MYYCLARLPSALLLIDGINARYCWADKYTAKPFVITQKAVGRYSKYMPPIAVSGVQPSVKHSLKNIEKYSELPQARIYNPASRVSSAEVLFVVPYETFCIECGDVQGMVELFILYGAEHIYNKILQDVIYLGDICGYWKWCSIFK